MRRAGDAERRARAQGGDTAPSARPRAPSGDHLAETVRRVLATQVPPAALEAQAGLAHKSGRFAARCLRAELLPFPCTGSRMITTLQSGHCSSKYAAQPLREPVA